MRKNFFLKPISKRFIDAFPKFKRENASDTDNYFWETWLASPFYTSEFTEDDLKNIYHHLLAHYYDWHYIYMDDMGIALNTMHIIEEYYANVKERLKLAEEIRNMSLAEFEKSGISINSQGSNPKVATNMDALIDLVDSQSANFQLKSKEQTIRAKFHSLMDGIMTEFIDRFNGLFVRVYTGLTNYIYTNEFDEEDEE